MREPVRLLLPFTGITAEILDDFKPTILDVGFKYGMSASRNNKFTIFIRLKSDLNFMRYLRDVMHILNIHEELDNNWVIELECLYEYINDWDLFIKGQYSKISLNGRNKILNNLPDLEREEWERIMRKSKDDIIGHIQSKLDKTNRSPVERRRIAEALYKENDGSLDTQELYKKPHLNTI